MWKTNICAGAIAASSWDATVFSYKMSECITVHVSYNLSILCLYLCLKPLFLYLPHQAVHSACAGVPLEAPAKYQHKVSYIKTRTRQLYAGKKSWIGVVFVSCYCKDVTTPIHIFGFVHVKT